MSPIRLWSALGLISSSLDVTTSASGKLSAYVAVAVSQRSTPQTISASASRAP